jgi:mgtE-like transporter
MRASARPRTEEEHGQSLARALLERVLRRGRLLLGSARDARQSLVALGFNSTTSFVAGIVLGSITGVFESRPGLLIMVPAAIGLRGNISTAFGNRLSTAIHTGQFRLSTRRDSLLVQNLEASFVLSAGLSLALAVAAKVGAVAIGLDHVLSIPSLALIAIAAGLLSSLVVHAITVVLAWAAVRYGWDLDNVVAPVDSTFGDVVTVPALWLCSHLLDLGGERFLSWAVIVAAVVVFAYGLASSRPIIREVTHQSWPILLLAVGVQTMAGLVLEQRLDALAVLPALLVLQPAFVSGAGALGGIMSSRTATRLHLGVIEPTAVPGREARGNAGFLAALAVVLFLYVGVGSYVVARLAGLASPALWEMVVLSLGAGVVAVAFALGIAYYSTIVAQRFRLDPDIYGVPAVTSSVDFIGSVVLIAFATVLVLQ